MTQINATSRNAAADPKTSSVPLAEGDGPEQDGSEDPQVGLESIRDTGGASGKESAQSKGIAPDGIPSSPSTSEHLNTRSGIHGAADSGQRKEGGAKEQKTATVGVGEGATVNHLPDGGPR